MINARSLQSLLGTLVVVFLAGLVLAPPGMAYGATIVVDETNDEINSDGDCSLREAIESANTDTQVDNCTTGSGDDIIDLTMGGTFNLSIAGANEDANQTGDLDILENLTINGNGSGSTFIDANSIDRVIHIDNGADVTINDVTITGGRAPDSSGATGGRGGGLWLGGPETLTMTGCVITGNAAGDSDTIGGSAGGIQAYGDLTLDNCTVSSNQSGNGLDSVTSGVDGGNSGYGGGINLNGVGTFTNCTIIDNATGNGGAGGPDADGGDPGYGGGLYATNQFTMTDCTVSENSVGAVGAAGSGTGSAGVRNEGGGIYVNGLDATLLRCTISGNDAREGGGIFILSTSTVDLDDCTISGNSADVEGGGLNVWTNVATANLTFCTVANNSAGSSGGGGLAIATGGTLTLQNTIVADNSTTGTGPNCNGTITSAGYNILEDTAGCTMTTTTGDQTGINPGLLALADNGGATQTHALPVSSTQAIDQIPDTVNGCLAGVSRDQRYYQRAGGLNLGGTHCDVGAYEYNSDVPVTLSSFTVD